MIVLLAELKNNWNIVLAYGRKLIIKRNVNFIIYEGMKAINSELRVNTVCVCVCVIVWVSRSFEFSKLHSKIQFLKITCILLL